MKESSFTRPLIIAISLNDTTPNPGQVGVVVWSSITNCRLEWNGTNWIEAFTPSSGFAAINRGGTNNATYTAPVANVVPLIYYDGTKFNTDAALGDLGYDTVGHALTVSNLKVNTGLNGSTLMPMVTAGWAAIYNSGLTPSNSNYALTHNTTTTALNSTSATSLRVNGVAVLSCGVGAVNIAGQTTISQTTNDTALTLSVFNTINNVTVNATLNTINLGITTRGVINAGVTNSGQWIGTYTNALRNYVTTGDTGTLATLKGNHVLYGHSNADVAAVPNTTNVYGIVLSAVYQYGTITNLYDLFLSADQVGVGVVTNRWGIYQINTANNALAGKVRIGSTVAPVATLDVTGSVASSGQYSNTVATGTAPMTVTSLTPVINFNTRDAITYSNDRVLTGNLSSRADYKISINSTPITYWLLATLPPSTTSTGDKLFLDMFLTTTDSNKVEYLKMVFGNRATFGGDTLEYVKKNSATTLVDKVGIIAYSNLDGSVSIYLSNKSSAFISGIHISALSTGFAQAATLVQPSLVTGSIVAPTGGTVVYDSTTAYTTALRYNVNGVERVKSLTSATTDINIGASAAPSAGQILVATSPTVATWQDAPASNSLATSGASVNVSASPSPAAGQVLVAATPTTAAWQDTPPAKALSSSTTTISVSGAVAPTAGQVLTAISSTAAEWQTPAGGSGGGGGISYSNALAISSLRI